MQTIKLFAFPKLSATSLTIFVVLLAAPAQSQNEAIEEITVYSATPLTTSSQSTALPHSVQSFSADDLQSSNYTSLADFLNRKANGVSINHAQNNVLQPDVQVRGFTASPLLGASQGVAVYINGARINEPFGDTVNWDLLKPGSIAQLDLISGANAIYGLNALGASLTLSTKTGFNHEGTTLGLGGGSFGRQELNLSHGVNNSQWATFISVDHFEEDGWRDFSPTEASNGYGAISYRNDDVKWDLYGFWADTALRGNGASPELLLQQDRDAVFTHPDISENNLQMISSRGRWALQNNSVISLNGFIRSNDTASFNGDGSEFEDCDPPLVGFLCDDDDPTEAVEDQFGNNVPDSFDAVNNISERQQNAWGLTLEYQTASNKHHHTVGLDIYQGDTRFESAVEFAELQTDRSTNRSGLFDDEGETELDSSIDTIGLYWVDNIQLNNRNELTLSLRYNRSEIDTEDQSGEAPDLTANHTFNQLNWGLGWLHTVTANTGLFVNLHQSSRTPSPVELACSHPTAPCTLPNTFLADPPLDEVVARNLEFGLRQQFNAALTWELNTFLTRIQDDIVFQTTGGVSSNEGFFSNASDTQRIGVAATLTGSVNKYEWQLAYTWLQATYEDSFLVSSPNHPDAMSDQINVVSGDHIPGLPEHALQFSVTWQLSQALAVIFEGEYQSGVYLRGDEANLDSKTDDFFIANATLQYDMTNNLNLLLSVSNLFDSEYETFGLYGEPDEVIPSLGDENTRFLSPSEPRGAWLHLNYNF